MTKMQGSYGKRPPYWLGSNSRFHCVSAFVGQLVGAGRFELPTPQSPRLRSAASLKRPGAVKTVLKRRTIVDLSVIRDLANMLDRASLDGDWRLQIFHRKPGNPVSTWASENHTLSLGMRAQELYLRELEKGARKHGFKKRVSGMLAKSRRISDISVRKAWAIADKKVANPRIEYQCSFVTTPAKS